MVSTLKKISLVALLTGAVGIGAGCGGGGGGGGAAPVVPAPVYENTTQENELINFQAAQSEVYWSGQGNTTASNKGLTAALKFQNYQLVNDFCDVLTPTANSLRTDCLDFWKNVSDGTYNNSELVGIKFPADKNYPVNLIGTSLNKNVDSHTYQIRTILAVPPGDTAVSVSLGYDCGRTDANGDPVFCDLDATKYAAMLTAYSKAIALMSPSDMTFTSTGANAPTGYINRSEYMYNGIELKTLSQQQNGKVAGNTHLAHHMPSITYTVDMSLKEFMQTKY